MSWTTVLFAAALAALLALAAPPARRRCATIGASEGSLADDCGETVTLPYPGSNAYS